MTHYKISRLSGLIAFCLFLYSCGSEKSKSTDQSPPVKQQTEAKNDLVQLNEAQAKLIGITTTSVQKKEMEHTIRLNGKVDIAPSHISALSSMIGGHITTIRVLPGGKFSKGQELARIEDHSFIQLQQDYLVSKAQIVAARLNYERQRQLNENKASSDKELQLAEAEYKTLLATQKALEEKLKLIHINPSGVHANNIVRSIGVYSPFSGIVSKVFVKTGQYITASDPVFELIDPQGLLLKLKVFENEISGIAIGQLVHAYTNQNPDHKQVAKVISIVPNIDADGAAEIIAKLDKPDPVLMNGMYINADLDLTNYQTDVLPDSSVVSYEGKAYVFEALSGNRFKLHEVSAGRSADGFTVIQHAGFLDGKKIVAHGAYSLLMALKNKVEE